jgi:K+-sensing histidine kinase KdpD
MTPMSDFKQLLSGNVTFIKSPFYIKYGVPFLLLVWATLFKLLLFETIGQQSPFVFYLVVIVLTARYFGEKAAIVTSIFTTLTVNYFFLYPYSSFSTDLNNLVQNFLFFVECGLVVGLSGTLRKTTERMHQRDMVFRALV